MPEKPLNPFNIAAHRSRVSDLPRELMQSIVDNMIDTSYGNDDSASFVIESSLKSGKAIRLWIDHLNQEDRSDEDEFRFHLLSFTVDTKAENYTTDDLLSYSNDDFFTFFVGNDYSELSNELCIHVPNFKK